MKLTPEQKRGIEERFAVLDGNTVVDAFSLSSDTPGRRLHWIKKLQQNIDACRDEVLVLVERLECDEAS